jgi:ABC-type multidrug transport system fused ATPase/permease subunit
MLMIARPDALAIQNLSMAILPGQKVGICGRTGRYESIFIIRYRVLC